MPKNGKRKTRRGGKKFHLQQLYKSLYQPAQSSDYVGIPSLPIVREHTVIRSPAELQSALHTNRDPRVLPVRPVNESVEEVPFRIADTLLPWAYIPVDVPQSEQEARVHPDDPRRFTWWPQSIQQKIFNLFGEL